MDGKFGKGGLEQVKSERKGKVLRVRQKVEERLAISLPMGQAR